MKNIYTALINYEGEDISKCIYNLGIEYLFEDLINCYKNKPDVLKGLIKYILWTYSVESEKIHIGIDWQKIKEKNYEAAFLPLNEYIRTNIIHLKDEAVIHAIKNWIEYQDSDTLKQYFMLRDLKNQMQLAATSEIKKATGEIDYDAKFKCADYAGKLTDMINDVESNLLQNNIHLKDAIKEVKATKIKTTMSVESFAR